MSENIIVIIDNNHRSRINDLADRLRAAGMRIDQVLGAVGIVMGTVAEAQRTAIVRIPGVAGIEDQKLFQLPPPDSDVQ